VTARIGLGPFSAIALDQMADTEAPAGTFYYANGSMVLAVRGASAPVKLLTTTGPALALAATTSDLYVQSALTIRDYAVPGGELRRSWTLPNGDLKATSAGLFAEGSTLWSWSDGATDQSGFEYATVDEISTATSAIRVVDQHAYPDDMAADRSGLYYETEIGVHGYLTHIAPAGTRTLSRPTSDVDAPLAIDSGSVVLFTEHGSGTPYLDRFDATSLGLVRSSRLSEQLLVGVGTSAGLLAVACDDASCADRGVVRIAPESTTVTGRVALAGLATLVEGRDPAALTIVKGHAELVRLG